MRLIFITISMLIAISLSYAQSELEQSATENVTSESEAHHNHIATTSQNDIADDPKEEDPKEEEAKEDSIKTMPVPPAAVLEFYQNPALPLGAVQAAPNVYSDVSRNHWAAQAIAHMTQLGIITGYPDSTFQGQNSISRYESAVLTARLYEFVIDYAEQLYLYTNQDVQTLQEVIRLQQAQIESQNAEIITLNEQLQSQAATQSQLQAQVNSVDSKVTQGLSPAQSTAVLEQLEQLNTDQQVNVDYLRQLEQQVQQLQQQLSDNNTEHEDKSTALLEQVAQLNTDQQVNADYLRQLEQQVQELQQQRSNLEPAHLASDNNEDVSHLEDTTPSNNNAANNTSDNADNNGNSVDFVEDNSYNGTAIAITPTDGQRPEKGLSLAPARNYPFYVGISPLGVNTHGGFTLGLRVGYDHLEGPVGIVGKFNYAVGAGLLTASVNALIPINTPMENLDIYAGLGLGINTTTQVTGLMLELPLGVEYFLNDEMSFFAEVSPDYRFGVHTASVSLSAGINFRF